MFISFAFVDVTGLGYWLWLGFHLILAIVGAVIGWFLTPPVFRLLFRLAFHRPAPASAVFIARLFGAAVMGFILFFCSVGVGGGGFGFGGGGGGWFGFGTGTGTGKGKGEADNPTKVEEPSNKEKEDKKTPPKAGFDDVLRIEMIRSKDYVVKSERWYLLQGKGPALTLEEIEAKLLQNKGKYKDMDIVIANDSVYHDHPAVVALERMARKHDLRPLVVPLDPAKRKKGD